MTSEPASAPVEPLVAPRPAVPSSRRTIVAYSALAAPALALMADTAVAIAGGWRIESRLDRVVVIALCVWLAATTVPLAMAGGRRLYGRYCPQWVALSASFCAAWLVAELALGPVLAQVAEPFHGRRPGLEFVYRPRPGIMRGVGPEAHVRFDSWGIRGPEPPAREAAYRILCLGGSSTACTYLDDAKTWPQLLADDLRSAESHRATWVGNAGVPGFRSGEHLRFIEESPLAERIDCLVVQVGINDFVACLAGPRPAPPRWTESRVRQLARAVSQRLATSGTLVEDTAGTVYERRRAMRAAAPIDSAEPDLNAGLREFEANVRRTIGAARARNLRLVFTTQPVLWRSDLDADDRALLWFGVLPDGRYLSVEQLRRGMDRYNDALRSLCDATGTELVDLAQLDGDPTAFYDDCHFTQSGAARVARLVADWFVAHPADARQETSAP